MGVYVLTPRFISLVAGLIFLLFVVSTSAAAIVIWVRKQITTDSDAPLPEMAGKCLKEMGPLPSVQTLPPRTSPVDEHTRRLVSRIVNCGRKYLEGAISFSEFSLDFRGNLTALEGLGRAERDALFNLECEVDDADFLLSDEELHLLVRGVVDQLREHFGV